MEKRAFFAKKTATLAALTAFSLITFLIEGLVPITFVPGAKLGLSNLFSLAALILYSPLEGFAVVGVRTLLGAIFAGNFSALLYSFTAGVVSCAVSSLFIYLVYPKVSVVATSVLAAVCHNLTQYLVFTILSGAALAFGFLSLYLVLLGALSGAIIGGLTLLTFKSIPKTVLYRAINA